jgi:tRNA-uridine 2-sulfurtransferase
VGQRRGLGLGTHQRHFVVDLDATTNTVVVGPRDALACRWLDLAAPTWTTGAPPRPGADLTVQVRAHGRPLPAWLVDRGDGWRVDLGEPAHGVAVGQAAVLYDGDLCLGGGRIATADRSTVGRAVTVGQ